MSTKWRLYSSAVARRRTLVRSISGGVRQSEGGHLHRTQEQMGHTHDLSAVASDDGCGDYEYRVTQGDLSGPQGDFRVSCCKLWYC